MRLHFHQDMNGFFSKAVFATFAVRIEPVRLEALNYRGIVFIGRQHAFAVQGVSIANHLEQGEVLLYPVNAPGSIENLVPAVLGVGLGKHHQLHIGGVTLQLAVALEQIIDFIIGQGQPEFVIGGNQGFASFLQQGNGVHGCRFRLGKQGRNITLTTEHGLSHAVMEQGGNLRLLSVIKRNIGKHGKADAPLNALNHGQAAIMGNV